MKSGGGDEERGGRDARAGGVSHRAMSRYFMLCAADGVAAGWALLLALLWTDVGRLGTLISAADHGQLILCVLALAFAASFGPIGVIVGVSMLKGDEG